MLALGELGIGSTARGMSAEFAVKLASILEAYFSPEDLSDLAELYDVRLESLEEQEPRFLSISRELATTLEHGNIRRLLDGILELADDRNTDGIAHTSWERQDFHRSMASVVREAMKLLETSSAPSEIAVLAGNRFLAKSKMRELLETATTTLFVVDPLWALVRWIVFAASRCQSDCLQDLSHALSRKDLTVL